MNHDDISTFEDMIACREAFLENPGVDVDFDGIAEGMDDDVLSERAILERWFDRLVEQFANMGDIVLYRHMTVPDFREYVAALDEGVATLGAHWSLSEHTWSIGQEQSEVDILMLGSIDREQIERFSTFQQNFSHPHEQEIVFRGSVRLASIRDLSRQVDWTPTRQSYPSWLESTPDHDGCGMAPSP